MKYLIILSSLLACCSLSAGAPVDTTGVEATAVQVSTINKVPTCNTSALWDYCLQSSDSLWCNSDGVLSFKTAELQAKCSGGCHCTVSGMGGSHA